MQSTNGSAQSNVQLTTVTSTTSMIISLTTTNGQSRQSTFNDNSTQLNEQPAPSIETQTTFMNSTKLWTIQTLVFIKPFINFGTLLSNQKAKICCCSSLGAEPRECFLWTLKPLRNSENGRDRYGWLVSGVYGAVAREGHTSRSSSCSRFASRYRGARRMRRLFSLALVLGACCRVCSAPASCCYREDYQ